MKEEYALAILARVKGNPYYRRAVDCPQYREAVDLREKALRAQRALQAIEMPAMPAAEDDLNAWCAATVAASEAGRLSTIKRDALTGLIDHCNKLIEAAVMTDGDRLLRSLAHDLDALMRSASEVVDRLGGARTPREVITAGTGDAWKELEDIAGEYAKLREAQQWVMRVDIAAYQSGYYLDDLHANDCAISNLDAIFPSWREQPVNHVVLSGVQPDPRPWPADPVEMLVWLVTSEAQVWVPTRRQLEALQAARHRRAHGSTPNVRPGRRPDKPAVRALIDGHPGPL